MAVQNDAKHTTETTTAPPPAAPQGPEAPGVSVSAVFSLRFGRPRARNPLCRVMAPPYSARGHIYYS
eukprot:16428250-Heterocapsa_arctica.AAC.1